MDTLQDVLVHFGVKGMKWGVRNSEQRSAQATAKADMKYDKSFQGIKGYAKVNNAIADRINPKLDVLNANPKYQGDLTQNPTLHKAYISDYRGLLKQALDETMADLGTNASGTKQMKLEVFGEGMDTTWQATMVDIEHAEGDLAFRIVPYFDSEGHITGQTIEPLADSLTHFLAHYGVKGMKWGVRKGDTAGGFGLSALQQKRLAAKAPSAAIATQKKPGTRVKATGGKNQPASDDAKRVAEIRRLAKKSTTDSLSNQQLKAAVERMQLEQNYSRLASSKKSIGRRFIEKLFKDPQARKKGAEFLDTAQAARGLGDDISKVKLT